MQFKHKNNLEVYLQVYVPLWYREMSFVTGASSKRLKEKLQRRDEENEGQCKFSSTSALQEKGFPLGVVKTDDVRASSAGG